MPCSPSDNNINVNAFPGSPYPGFGLPISPVQLPYPGFNLPTDLLEKAQDLVNKLGAVFPSGVFKPFPDSSMKNVMDYVADLLSKIAPFLSFYNFIMAALRMIICIIEVLCAIPNPFAVASKLRTLFAECLPNFLNLFPFFALIAMIIALLLLILALIEYIIETLIAMIERIVANLTILADGLTLQDAQSTLAAAQKIAALLCGMENLFAIFIAIASLIAIIEALAKIAGGAICDDADPNGCCPEEICPQFIKNSQDGIFVTNGVLVYNKQLKPDTASIFSSLGVEGIENLFTLEAIRKERWQIYDGYNQGIYPINSIITAIGDNDFWPDPLELSATTKKRNAPYTVDLRLQLNPKTYVPSDGYGTRYFKIKDCIVVRRPYTGVYDNAGTLQAHNLNGFPNTGTLNIEGGLVYEDDDTPYMIDGVQATLNNFIFQSPTNWSSSTLPNDTVTFPSVEFTWKPNHGVLAKHDLITVGCMPEVSLEKAVQNSKITAEGGGMAIIARIPATPNGSNFEMGNGGVGSSGTFLPNIAGAQACLSAAITAFRQDISILNAAEFQAAALSCLNDLKEQTLNTVCNSLIEAASQFQSEVSIDTDVQFTTKPIQTKVILKDPTGTVLSASIPPECLESVLDKLKAEITFGEISKFEFDGDQAFIAEITSKHPGSGQLTITFNNKVFNKINTGTVGVPSSIEENVIEYTFIGGVVDPAVRRDSTDVAQSEV